MPGITPVKDDILQARLRCRAGDQISLNVLHYRVNSVAGGGLNLTAIASQLGAAAATVYRAWMPATAEAELITLQNLTPPITPAFAGTGFAGAGTADGDLVPRQVSGLITERTSLGGRNQIGRIYVGFVANAYIDTAGELTGGGIGFLQAIADVLGPGFTANVGATQTILDMIVRHPDAGGPPPLPNGTLVVTLTAQTRTATQKRRGDYGRPNP